jgi:predicted translin family RNA/ssDNA-binding protein
MSSNNKRTRYLLLQPSPTSPSEVTQSWEILLKTMQNIDEQREVIIKRSREVQKGAKQAIYALHRNDLVQTTSLLNTCKNIIQDLIHVVKQSGDATLRQGSLSSSIEEYVEALIFSSYLTDIGSTKTKLTTTTTNQTTTVVGNDEDILDGISVFPIPLSNLPSFVDAEEYLGGLMDATGEIQRFAILEAARGNFWQLGPARRYLEHVLVNVMKFDFRNGNLRKKSDSLKYTLKRLEEALYDVSVMGRRRLEQPQQQQQQTNDTLISDE